MTPEEDRIKTKNERAGYCDDSLHMEGYTEDMKEWVKDKFG